MPHDYDVIIAGAGPGGVAMAARLLQSRHVDRERILILERERFPRAKPCGGGLTGHAELAMAELDLTLAVPHLASTRARVRFGDYERGVDLGKPVCVIRRDQFDADLVTQIRAKGVDVSEGEAVDDFAVDAQQVTVTTSKGRRLTAAVLVGADGVGSQLRKQLVPDRKELPHRLFRFELDLPAEMRGGAMNSSILYDFTPMAAGLRGYLWIFPMPGDLVNVGIMHYPIYRLSGRALVDMLRHGLRQHGLELPERGTRGWPVWGYEPGRRIAGPRLVTIGDAAGVDALTGEGIAVAMEQAIFAGAAIDRAFAGGDFSFATYRRDLRRATVGRELTLDRRLARLLYRSKRWRDWLALILYDRQVIEMYAARVAGTEILANQKLRLFRRLFVHFLRLPGRRRALAAALAESRAELPPPGARQL